MTLATASQSWVSSGMLAYLTIVLVGLLGLFGAGWWVILLGAVGLSIEPWFRHWETLEGRPSTPLDWPIASLFAAVFGNALIACSGSYIIGIMGGAFVG